MRRKILLGLLVLLSICGFAGATRLPERGSMAYKQDELIVRFADTDSEQLQGGRAVTGPWSRRTIRSMISDAIVPGATVEKEYDKLAPGLVSVRLPKDTSVLDAFIQFNLSDKVAYAEPNYKYKLLAVPNDPSFPQQWALDNTGQTGGTDDADIDAPEAWDINTGNPDIIVAVADTGIDYRHPDLANNMWVNPGEIPDNGVDDDGNGYVDDVYGYDFAGADNLDPSDGDSDPDDFYYHGTHAAGLVGAIGNNSVGVSGVCWNVKLMALKVFADDYLTEADVFATDAVAAIEYAVDNSVTIFSASWGGDPFSQTLYDAVKAAGDRGMLFVFAAGNDYGNNNDENPVYPSSFDLENIISVMATDQNDVMSDFSNFGPTSVDVAAPGTSILSTTPSTQQFPMIVFQVATNYDRLNGTSMSAPIVAGQCALIWSQYPSLPASLVKGVVLKTVDPVLDSPRRCLSGGRINLQKSLTVVPPGRLGHVLNTKDDPNDPANLYPTIQAAINDAVDGDVLIAEANTQFIEAIDFRGKAITLRSGDINEPDDPNIYPDTLITGILGESSVVTFANGEGSDSIIKGFTISWGNADYGGGIRCEGSSPIIEDCIITDNFAKYYGAGIDCYDAAPTIRNCTITRNQTSGNTAVGGGVNCDGEVASPLIVDCLISENFADSVGGGIACYGAAPTILNCVIADNSALYGGGGVYADSSSSPVLTNCTIVVSDPNSRQDGGVHANHDSNPVITNCILWGNGDDLLNCSATYSCIEDDDRGIGNIHIEPTFVSGPLGDYYLSQTAAGQLIDSSCVDLADPGTDPALRLHTYTTRTDGVPDTGIIDMGAHYPALPAGLVQLDITIMDANVPIDPNQAHGRVEPGSGTYRQYEVVQLRAYPDPGYRVKAWSGTDDDSPPDPNSTLITMIADTNVTIEFEEIPLYRLRTEVISGHGLISPHHRRGEYYREGTVVQLVATPDVTYIVDQWSGTDDDTSWANVNRVTMDSDKEISVLFRQPKSLHVPAQYETIGLAIEAAYPHGDKIIVSPGTYFGGYDFLGKAITIASEHPDDPCTVAATVINISGSPAFTFQSGEGHDSVIDGFTIQGQGDTGPVAPPDTGGTGGIGADALGGAISCLNGSSPTLSHLVIRDVVARGQDGEDATFVFPDPDPAPDPADPLDPLAPLPDPPVPDPNDPNDWAPADPNRPDQPDTSDPNAVINAPGFDGEDGEPGAPGDPGADGMNGAPGYNGGDAGVAYGGAMYFDADSNPIILNCTLINCQAIGGNGGSGGQGQNGQDGQDGQPGQDGQEGQSGGEGIGDGAQGAAGNGGAGGDGGPGGGGGRGGDGGKGGDGGEALGGAIYFGSNCHPTIRFCRIVNCATTQGLGNIGGNAGSGGTGGNGAEPGAGAGGGTGEPDGQDGGDGVDGPGGSGGDGGTGGDMGINGTRSWAGAIYFGEDCQVDMTDTLISHCLANNIVATYTYGGGDGGDGGIGGDGSGDADGGAGGTGGDGGGGGPPGAADPNDPNVLGPGTGGAGGAGGAAGGAAGEGGAGGLVLTSTTPAYGGANYYDYGCHVELTGCTISYNTARQYDASGLDGGGEYYQDECTAIFERCSFIGNLAGFDGSGGGQYFNEFCTVRINDCNYVENSSGDTGGGLLCLTDSSFEISNSNFIGNSSVARYSSGGALYGGGVWDWDAMSWRNGNKITIKNSYFAGNEAAFGGGLYWHGEGAEISIADSVISSNTAEHGGGMYWSTGTPVIKGSSIIRNTARARYFMPDDIIYQEYYFYVDYERPYGGGGGFFCWSSDAIIEDCFITDNSSAGSGGGVYFGGDPSQPQFKNCLVKGNAAVLDGGGIVSYWNAAPTISNCTIANNRAFDPDNTNHGRGGGLSCSYESQTTLIDSILWDNTATSGHQLSIGSDDDPAYLDRPATLTVSYCDIQGNRSAGSVYIEPGRTLNWGNGNIDADPLFAVSYYLSQTAAGQAADSPCLDAGSTSAVALGLDEYTTRADALADTGVVDMGFHYDIGVDKYRLTVKVIGSDHGTVKPLGGSFDKFTVVTLRATADPGYRVAWIGTDDDDSRAPTNTVTMDSDKIVTVEFVKGTGETITVPDNYPTIQEAVNHAREGDIITVEPGTWVDAYAGVCVLVDKSITISSKNPDDPNCVVATIIDGSGSNVGIRFTAQTDEKTVLNGITIQNCGLSFADSSDGDRDGGHPNGFDGTPGEGGAIYIENGGGPTIKNCLIRNNSVTGGNGGDGEDADDTANAGRGGWAGWAHGGAIWCGPGSTPKFVNCIIEGNVATGGNGGNGGNSDVGSANYGGNWSRSQVTYYNPNNLDAGFTNGNLWGVLTWDFAPTYGPIYNEPNLTSFLGDYRLYSGLGGGVYCDQASIVTFEHCQIRNNSTAGGVSGVGGDGLEPQQAFEAPSYGGGVYCAADSRVTFRECTFEDNVASEVVAGVAPNYRLDPYAGYGGGVAAGMSAAISFTDCNFVDNEADSGGGVYIRTTEATIIDCNLVSNTALRGAGFLGVNSSVDMLHTTIRYNQATIDVNDPNNQGVLAQGAGLFCLQGGINVQDCNVANNQADFAGGGVYLRDVSGASLTNNLITNNLAGRDGGGVSANWYTHLAVINCTFSANAVVDNIGEPNDASFGGGLYCSYESNCVITDSIFWDNFAVTGNAIVVGTGFEFDKRPSTLSISHSDVKNGKAGVWVDDGCTLYWDESNINADPLFVKGPRGDHYLSQIAAGQSRTSPCVDAGSDNATNTGMWHYTTRTDEASDTGLVDMGYHHPLTHPCRLCDLAFDGVIEFSDYARVADAWLEDSCSKQDAWCQGADLTSDTRVDFRDILFLADCWLVLDATPPIPDPSRWETEPYLSSGTSVTMKAQAAFDAWGWDVEYYFDCIDDAGCHDSGWQTSPTYTDSGLTPDVEYGYRVRARDGVQWIPDDGTGERGNKTEWSEIGYAGPDNLPPTPAPYIETIFAASPVSITMVATTAYDDSGVEYYFENTVGNGHNSGWIADPNFTDVNLAPDTEYGYRVRARDGSAARNTTPWSDTVLLTTPIPADTTPPDPDPAEWDTVVDANGYDGYPREVPGTGMFDFAVSMRAVVAVDAGGGPVEYFFQCTTENGFSSGWIATEEYRVLVGRSGQGHRFRVKARDEWGNETAWSTIEVTREAVNF